MYHKLIKMIVVTQSLWVMDGEIKSLIYSFGFYHIPNDPLLNHLLTLEKGKRLKSFLMSVHYPDTLSPKEIMLFRKGIMEVRHDFNLPYEPSFELFVYFDNLTLVEKDLPQSFESLLMAVVDHGDLDFLIGVILYMENCNYFKDKELKEQLWSILRRVREYDKKGLMTEHLQSWERGIFWRFDDSDEDDEEDDEEEDEEE